MLLLLVVVLLLANLLPTMPSPQNSRPENWPVLHILDGGEEGFNRQELVATEQDRRQRRLGDTRQPIMPTPIVFPHTSTTFHAYSSNSQQISSNHEILQAQIELQKEKIRAHELAVEERRRSEQLRMQERGLAKRERQNESKNCIVNGMNNAE